jgi:adenine-specific DNA-methyltransferase
MDEIIADADGRPLLSRPQSLLDCPLSEAQIRDRYPDFWRYLQQGMQGIAQRYLCSHRSPWYSQERREPTFFLCSYIARRRSDGRLQRFIFNRSVAIAGNNYLLLYPRDSLARYVDGNIARARAVWRELCRIEPKALSHAGRVYAGGMHKLEPSELARVPAPGLAALLSGYSIAIDEGPPPEMIEETGLPTAVRTPVAKLIANTEIVPASPLETYANCADGST